jgi:hypothetical protein
MDLPFRRIVIDSRTAVQGAGTSDFAVQLPTGLQLPPDTACYVLDVALSYGFYTVEEGENDTIYFIERYWDGTQDQTIVRSAVLAAGSYTSISLATELQSAMNAGSQIQGYTVVYDDVTNSMLITLTYSSPHAGYGSYHGFTLLTAAVMENTGVRSRILARQPFDFNALRDASGLLSLEGSGQLMDIFSLFTAYDAPSLQGSFATTFRTGHVEVRSVHALYVHSEALAGMRSLGPSGSRSVICRVPVTTTFGGMLHQTHSSHPLDFIPVGGRTLQRLDFSVRDSFGRLVNMHGGHVSLTLLFVPEPQQ